MELILATCHQLWMVTLTKLSIGIKQTTLFVNQAFSFDKHNSKDINNQSHRFEEIHKKNKQLYTNKQYV